MNSLRCVINSLSKAAFFCVPKHASWPASAYRGHAYSHMSLLSSSKKMQLGEQLGVNSSQQYKEKSSSTSYHVISAVTSDSETVWISWTDGSSAKFHNIWLRDHCQCSQCYNSTTYQKEFNILDVPLDIKPIDVSLNEQNSLSIKWPDSHVTAYDATWLKQHSYGEHGASGVTRQTGKEQKPFLWDKNTIETKLPCPFEFNKVISEEDELNALFRRIVKYGFAFVEETPTTVDAIEEIAIRLGGFVKETHYGKVWEFSNEFLEHADTAYTSDYLRGHTDSTYFSHPAGLQMLHCVEHEGTGGLNLLVDGFFAAEKLKQDDKASFDFLTSTIIPFHYKSENLHLKAHGPMIELDPFDGSLSQIRFNTYDMATLDCMKYEDIAQFYKALRAYCCITCAPENQLWFKLVPGLVLIMGNWRVLHGRSSFTGKRTMQGCYVNGDDFFGKYRAKAVTHKDSNSGIIQEEQN